MIFINIHYIYVDIIHDIRFINYTYIYILNSIDIPVVPHKAVAEVSKIGNL